MTNSIDHFSLDQGKAGQEFILASFQGDSVLQDRLVELGFVRGERLKISRKTFFGDFVVQVKNTEIALRRYEASCLVVNHAS